VYEGEVYAVGPNGCTATTRGKTTTYYTLSDELPPSTFAPLPWAP
jgi:hypothetical protein